VERGAVLPTDPAVVVEIEVRQVVWLAGSAGQGTQEDGSIAGVDIGVPIRVAVEAEELFKGSAASHAIAVAIDLLACRVANAVAIDGQGIAPIDQRTMADTRTAERQPNQGPLAVLIERKVRSQRCLAARAAQREGASGVARELDHSVEAGVLQTCCTKAKTQPPVGLSSLCHQSPKSQYRVRMGSYVLMTGKPGSCTIKPMFARLQLRLAPLAQSGGCEDRKSSQGCLVLPAHARYSPAPFPYSCPEARARWQPSPGSVVWRSCCGCCP
jgi:hypothetical protein